MNKSWNWFFELYEQITVGNSSCRPQLLKVIEEKSAENDAVQVALGLFLLTFDEQKFGSAKSQVGSVLTVGIELCSKALSDLMSIRNSCETVELAILSGGLKSINLYLKSPEITKLTSATKNYAYQNCVQEGSLMSSSERGVLNYDLLLSCVPLGLFEPEDLVLVEAIKTLSDPQRLEMALPEERSLFAWYWTEQGSYAKARNLIQVEDDSSAIDKIVRNKLKNLNQLASRFIRHSPEGNGNRYEPLIEERFPKLVSSKDEVTVRAQSVPLSSEDPVELVFGGDIVPGEMKEGFWEFKIPRASAGKTYSYYLRFTNSPDICTSSYEYEVLNEKTLEQVESITETPDEISIFGNGIRISLRVNNGGQLNIEATSTAEIAHHANLQGRQTYELRDFSVEITPNPFSFSVFRRGTKLVTSKERCVNWLEGADGDVKQIALSIESSPAGIYGLGERYNEINQYGNFVDQFVYNQYKDQGLKTYIPMPVFYSDSGVGMHVATNSYSWFDFGKAQENTTVIGVEDSILPIQILDGTISQQIAQFVGNTGKPEMVPAWALGPWMSSNNWDSEAEVRRQVELTKLHEIPSTVLVIEAWSDEATFYIFNDATYEENNGDSAHQYSDFEFPDWGRWPDPKGLVDHLHQNDLKCVLWQIPIVKQVTSLTHTQKSNDEASLIKNGYGVRNADGSPYRLPEGWFKDSLLLDFTNEDAVRWWFDKRQYLLDDLNVDGFKTDGGECIFGKNLVFSDGSDGREMRNRYPNDYISAYYDFVQQNDGITFSRSGYTGAQSFPAHWAGDECSTWDAFKRSILAGLSSGMSGIIFWGWDLGGFSGPIPSAELYIRSTQMACFCPIMQFHAESKAEFNQDRTPWNIAERTQDDRALSVYKYYANFRMSLMPYMVREAQNCVETHTPMMRAMVLDYQDDPNVTDLWDQYLFGRDLLVAPIISEGATSRDVYLPDGDWWHIFENRGYRSGTHRVSARLEEIPVFAKSGTVIPFAFDQELQLGGTMPSNIDVPTDIVLLVVGNSHNQVVYEESRDVAISVTWNENGSVQLEKSGQPEKNYSVVFTDTPAEVSLNGELATSSELSISGTQLTCVEI